MRNSWCLRRARAGRSRLAAQALRAVAATLAVVLTGPSGSCRLSESGGRNAVAQDTALRRLADELLPAAETHSGLPARGPVRLASRSREDLEAFLIDEMARQLPPARVAAIVRTYARLGLVPDTLDLAPLLRSLLLEQVIGYFDPARDTLYVLDRVDESQIRPVLVHELVHALQDQYVDLDSLMRANVSSNDRAMAAQAAIEGHATYAMFEWQMGQLTGAEADLTKLPGLETLLGDDPLAAAGLEMPVLREAPAVIRESLLFPYLGGLTFVQKMWSGEEGRVPPLGERMPASTEQILHPERFRAGDVDRPTDVDFWVAAPAEWEEVFTDGLGEVETRVLLREFLTDRSRADRAAAGWDGDRYRLLDGPPGEVFVWATVWDSERDGLEFETAVDEALRTRYAGRPEAAGRTVRVDRLVVDGRTVVTVSDAPAGAAIPSDLTRVRLAASPASGGP